MKKLILCMMLITASCMAFAQNSPVTYTVKGVLLDSLTLEGEPYATIRIVKKEAPTKPVKLAVTDTNGKFQEQITGSGNYVISITSIGKSTVVREFTLEESNKTMDLGNLYTSDDANELAAVEVVAQKPLVKVDIDKIEYNIQDDPDSKTNSVLEMLRKVPLVTVDGEDNIQVNGSSSFKVHVNGKPNNMMSDNPTEVLKSIPAHTIKHIEVITNPGAKYDAEGVGGILNIVTLGGGFEGYTATFNASASNMGLGGGVYVTTKKEKFTVTGRYNYNYNDRPRSYSEGFTEYFDSKTTERNTGSSKGTGSFQHGSLEASYEIDTLRLITMSFGMYGGDNDSKGQSLFTTTNNATGDIYNNYNTLNKNESSWYSIRGNIDYQRSFSVKERLLTFSYNINTRPQSSDSYTDYTFKKEDIVNDWLIDRLRNMRSDGSQNTTEHTFQLDYTTPIAKIHTLETGLKYIIRNNISDNDRYTMNANGGFEHDNDGSSHYKHLNNILAAYAGHALRYKAFSSRIGVRYERTMQDVEYKETPDKNFDVNFNDIVPSASAGFKIGQTQNIRVGYNMRIWRPSIYNLNPYLNDANPTNVSQGNSNLKSEKNHSFNLSYSSFTSKFNLNFSLRHSFTNNSIERVTELRKPSEIDGWKNEAVDSDTDIRYSTYKNIGKSRYTGLSGYVNYNASPKTRIYMNVNGGYNKYESPSLGLENSGWNCFMYGGVQHTFPWELRVSLNGMVSTPYVSLQGKGASQTDYSVSVNRSFLKKRLTISVYASNLFEKYKDYKNTTDNINFKDESVYKYPARRFGINVSYRIGDLKAQVKKAARTINNDDVKGGGEGGGEGGN
ncbi:outer membrane beta-barrel family protein [Bacteroides sp. 519]|uniref:outer membrane beta-barrel family protein n=1 Tax=Bacteroides sp. 519 TaxID=2302937 RepID=UPI0013D5EC5C|nr:outer membrane beta-barrel family protein [Bacteroides sp. 519]NDV57339.1 TonB-dependent receptor [Bacteroides sp. 519]